MTFKKGESGNPKGRPRGIIDRRIKMKNLIYSKSKELAQKALEMALNGNEVMLKMILAPILNRLSVADLMSLNVSLTKNTSFKDRCYALDKALEEGNISVSAYKILMEATFRKFDHHEIDERLNKLEKRNEARIVKTD